MPRTTIRTEDITSAEVTSDSIENSTIAAGDLAATLDLSTKTVTLAAGAVTPHVTVYDDSKLRNDIATLALHSAIADNKAAYNLTNSFLDQFEDATGVDVQTNTALDSTEYISTLGSHNGLDSYTKLLLHGDGVDGGTTITDSSARGASTVIAGQVHTEDWAKKFGTTSLEFDGTNDKTTTGGASPGHTDYCLEKTLDWTVDYWFYDQAPTSSWGRHIAQETVAANTTNDGWSISKQGTSGTLNFGHDSSTVLFQSSTVISANTWYHLCLEHDDSADTLKMVLRWCASSKRR